MFGPFNFRENKNPISPIVWLCVLEGDGILKKPFQLILPHYLTGLTKKGLHYHQVGFAKAGHEFSDEKIRYSFSPCVIEPLFASFGDKGFGVLKSNHCCFYCLERNITEEKATEVSYCLGRIENVKGAPTKNEVYFAAIYNLDTCMRVR